MNFATWVGKKIVVVDQDGTLQPPGAGPGIRIAEPDGGEVTLLARGDSFDLYIATRKAVYNHSITPRAAVRIGWFLVWWWVRSSWFGLKLRMWRWVLASALKER